MKDVTIGLCNDFRTYILKIRVKQSGNIISRNSAAGYWSTFRALLKLAYKEGWLRENVNDYLDRIDWEEPKINYLEMEEVKRPATTPCKVDVLKRASLFACMTGLRISGILQLRWENIEMSPDGGYCMRIRTQKTKTQATLPLSDEALSYCGEPGRGMVFKGLTRAHTREPFKKWLKDAGIKKKNNLPRTPAYLRYTTDNQWHGHLHCQQDAYAQKRGHDSDLRRSRESEKSTMPPTPYL